MAHLFDRPLAVEMDEFRQRRGRCEGRVRRCRVEAHAIARAFPRQLAQSRVAMAPGPAPRLLVVVHTSSDATDGEAARRLLHPLRSGRLHLRSC